MVQVRLPAGAWKWLVAALAAAVAMLIVAEASHALRPMLRDGTQGSLGVLLADKIASGPDGQGTYTLRVDEVAPGSPMQQAGARRGDYLHFDRNADRWRQFAPGETIGLTLLQPAGARHLEVQTVAQPVSFADQVDYWGRLAVAVPALLFGLLVGFRQPEGRSYRCLSLMFLALGTAFFYSFTIAPPGLLASASKLLQLTMYNLIWYLCVVFALAYQPYRRTRLRHCLALALPAYRVLALVTIAYACWFGLGYEAPYLWLFNQLEVAGGLALVLGSLFDGWRQGRGEMRQRHRWLLLAMAWGAIPPVLTLIPALDWTVNGARATVLLYFAGQLIMFALLAYAVLRHRVFNFDFAVSRAVVFSVISIILLSAFGLVEWLLAPLIHGHAGPTRPRLMLDAALAVAITLAFSKVHDRIEERVERFFFRSWHENEHQLRAFVAQAAHIGSIETLLASTLDALGRFTGHAGAAVYLRQAGGDYALAAATLDQPPPLFGTNDPLAVALRADLAPLHQGVLRPGAADELALPMCHRGALNGFILLGSKPHGESYRPDETALLGFAAHQVGLDLHALRVEALELAVRELAERTARQGKELQAAAGRRQLPQPGPFTAIAGGAAE